MINMLLNTKNQQKNVNCKTCNDSGRIFGANNTTIPCPTCKSKYDTELEEALNELEYSKKKKK